MFGILNISFMSVMHFVPNDLGKICFNFKEETFEDPNLFPKNILKIGKVLVLGNNLFVAYASSNCYRDYKI